MTVDKVKMKGRSVEEAITSALEVLKLSRDQVDVKVINEGKGGVLGVFGGEDAEVEVGPRTSVGEMAKDFLQGILDKMGFYTTATLTKEEEDGVFLEVKGDDMGRIIGKEGATLDALQYIVGMMITRAKDRRIRATIDAEGYRKKRTRKLERIAEETAYEAERVKGEVELPPMTAADRRAVHIAIQAFPNVGSFSRGEGAFRHIVVAPKDMVEKLTSETPKEETPENQ